MIVPNFKDGDAMNWETEMLISGNAYKRVYEKRLEGLKSKYGLKRIDLDILYFLCRYRQRNTSKEITEQNQYTKGHVSQSIERLVKKGLVRTMPDEADRRCLRIIPEESAEAVYAKMHQVREQMFEDIFRGISQKDIGAFERVSQKVYENMHEEV